MNSNLSSGRDQQFAVMVPCSQEKFGEFIAGLLGKPHVIRGAFSGTFDISLEDVENFYHLLNQRITEQNSAHLVQFSALVKFNDGTSVEIPSLDDLRKYSEVKPVVSTGVTITFVYLRQFKGKDFPERQQIEIDIHSSNEDFVKSLNKFKDYNKFSLNGNSFHENTGYISFRVSHTARTWGSDIENLLKDHIKGLFKSRDSRLRRFAKNWSISLYMVGLILSMSIMITAGYYISKKYLSTFEDGLNKSIVGVSEPIEVVRGMLSYSVKFMLGPDQSFFIGASMAYLIFGTVICMFWMALIMFLFDDPEPSFVKLTRKSLEDRQVKLEKYNEGWILSVTLYLFSIFTAVLANGISSLLF